MKTTIKFLITAIAFFSLLTSNAQCSSETGGPCHFWDFGDITRIRFDMPTQLYESAEINLSNSTYWNDPNWRLNFMWYSTNSSQRRNLCSTFSPEDNGLGPGEHTLWYFMSANGTSYANYKSYESSYSCTGGPVSVSSLAQPYRHGNTFTVLADPDLDLFFEGSFTSNNALVNGCRGESVNVVADASSSDFNSYEWFYNGTRVNDGTISNPLSSNVNINVNWSGTRTYEVRAYGPYGSNVRSTIRIRSNDPSVSITAYSGGSLVATNSNFTICEGESLELRASNGFASYSWSPSSDLDNNNSRIVVSTPTRTRTYTVTATDANGCEATEDFRIDVSDPDLIDANAGNNIGACKPEGGTETGNVSDGASPSGGSWSCTNCPTGLSVASNGNYTISSSAAVGQYNLVYSVTQGTCTDTDTKTISVVNAPTIILEGSVEVCANTEYRIEPTISGGSGLSYSWSPTTGLNNPLRLNPTATLGSADITYTLTVTTTDGCSVSESIFFDVDAGVPVEAGTNQTVCKSDGVIVLAGHSPSGGTFSGAGINSATGSFNAGAVATNVPHVITYRYINGNGCETSDTKTITVLDNPSVEAGENVSICVDPVGSSFVDLGATPSGGIWSCPGCPSGTLIDPVTGEVSNNTLSGTYQFFYTVNNGCEGKDSKTVFFNEPPEISTGADVLICSLGESAQLNVNTNGGSGLSYRWSPAATLDDPFKRNPVSTPVDNVTVYTIEIEDARGCISTDQLTVRVDNSVVVNAGSDLELCENEDPYFLGTRAEPAGGSFSGTGITGNSFDPSVGPGVYDITYSVSGTSGCDGVDNFFITVKTEPTVNAGSNNVVCLNDEPLNLMLTANPTGGRFSGPGVLINNTFDPSVTGIGDFEIFYDYEGANGCSSFDTRTIRVTPLPSVNAGSNLFICISSGLIDLEASASPKNGVFTGNGVSNGIFDPLSAGVGQHLIRYEITEPSGCNNFDERVIQVFDEVNVDLGGDFTVCSNQGVINLNDLPSIAGGDWSGTGVSGNSFNPSSVVPGEYALTYNVTDITNCEAVASVNVTVIRPQAISMGSSLSVCSTASPIALGSGVSPAGGYFNGPGMIGATFYPDLAGVGVHDVLYTIVDLNGCENTGVRRITVTAPNPVDAGPNTVVCLSSEPVDLDLSASVPGGTWSGVGVNGGFFNPTESGAGTFTINYEVNLGSQCITTDTRVITVRDDISINAGADVSFCFDEIPYDLTVDVSRSGGTFIGRGVVDNVFYPSVAGTGIHNITYKYTDAFGCKAQDSKTMTVFFPTTVDAGPFKEVCNTSEPLDLSTSAYPSGGSWTGPGVIGNTFDPEIVGVGDYILTYSYQDNNLCTVTDTRVIEVVLPETINAGPNITVCVSSPSIDLDLDVSETGGIWSGSGVEGSFFNPSLVGEGNYVLTYTLDDGRGCVSEDYRNVSVRGELDLDVGDPITMCYTDGIIDLGQRPNFKGGDWRGRGVIENNFFDPKVANPGTHVVTYEVVNEFGCRASETLEIEVLTPPVVSAGADLVMCVDNAARDLSPDLYPSGGSVSGFGIIGTTFHPDLAGPGIHVITYLYTDANGCVNDDTRIITVNSKPVVEAGSNFEICINASPVELKGSVPSNGGVWSGVGVIANVFDPLAAGLGYHYLYYSFTDVSGCSNADSIRVNVLDEPNLMIGAPLEVCLDDSPINLTEDVNIQGGEFDGDGVTGVFFDPDRAGVGTTIISYELRFNGCILREYRNIRVHSNTNIDFGDDVVMCIDSNPYRLTDDINVFGGTFSGNGVTGNFFDPVAAGLGSHLVSYDYVNAYGCSSSDSKVFTVQEQINISAGEDLSLCVGVESYDLSGHGNPSGGIYVGPGITGNNVFSPTEVGVGAYEITYILESDNGCISSNDMYVVVEPSSIANFGVDTIVCITSAPINLNFNDELNGGNWSGEGVVNNKFYPSLNGAGVFIPTYTNTSLDCDIAARRRITVVNLPSNATSSISRIEGCVGEFVELEATISEEDRNNNVVVEWYREGDEVPLQTGELITHEIIGEERVYFQSVNQFGCESGQSSYISIVLNNPSAEMEVSDDTPNFGKPIQFTASRVVNAISFEWDFGDGTYSTERNPYKFYYESDTFSVNLILSSSSGCETTVTMEDWIIVGEEVGRSDTTNTTLSAKEMIDGQAVEIKNQVLEIYPLPTKGAFSMDIMADKHRSCETYLVGMDGQIINRETKRLIQGRNTLNFDYENQRAGIYFLMIVGEDGVTYRSKILIVD